MKTRKKAALALLAMGMSFSTLPLLAQEGRKPIANPSPAYPETARKFHASGVVKVEVVIAPDGRVKQTKVVGGHPLLVDAVLDTLKSWKFAPANSETTELLQFNFHP